MADPRKHTIEQGEHVSAIAAKYGLTDWQTIQGLPEDPSCLFPGRVVTIPVQNEQKEGAPTEKNHPIEVDLQGLCLRLEILRDDLTPAANAKYVLTIPGEEKPREGTTQSNGRIEVENLPRDARTATLVVRIPPKSGEKKDGEVAGEIVSTWELEIGGLHPVCEEAPDKECLSGVQQRLFNLGFYPGPVTGKWNDATKSAIRTFRQRIGLSPSDKSDEELQNKLREIHDTASPIPPEKK